jgi:hypothetical protein
MNDEEIRLFGELFSELRDLDQRRTEIIDELLSKIGKPILDTKELQYDVMKVVTRQTEGPNGIYLKVTAADNQNNPDYLALVEDLKAHNGKLTRQGYFCWSFDDQKTCGMKLSKK